MVLKVHQEMELNPIMVLKVHQAMEPNPIMDLQAHQVMEPNPKVHKIREQVMRKFSMKKIMKMVMKILNFILKKTRRNMMNPRTIEKNNCLYLINHEYFI